MHNPNMSEGYEHELQPALWVTYRVQRVRLCSRRGARRTCRARWVGQRILWADWATRARRHPQSPERVCCTTMCSTWVLWLMWWMCLMWMWLMRLVCWCSSQLCVRAGRSTRSRGRPADTAPLQHPAGSAAPALPADAPAFATAGDQPLSLYTPASSPAFHIAHWKLGNC